MISRPWSKLRLNKNGLQLKTTLIGGQSFRWKKASGNLLTNNDGHEEDSWIGVMANCVWLLSQSDDHLLYKILGEIDYPDKSKCESIRFKVVAPKKRAKSNSEDGRLYGPAHYENLLRRYFRLDVDLTECYAKWSNAHQHFRNEAGQFYAVRVLDQDPVENLFSFICSQNNHISRISSLVEKLCTIYGSKICDIDGVTYYAFPDYLAMAKPEVEDRLRRESFGYRAKFIQRSAAEIDQKGGLEWFARVQDMDYKNAHQELVSLTGIGPKVADCICLMSLNHLQAIPVDTHVFKIAVEHYLPSLRTAKSVTPKIYTEIGDTFRAVYGPLAGWAQTVLFCADLKKFKETTESPLECSKPKKKRK